MSVSSYGLPMHAGVLAGMAAEHPPGVTVIVNYVPDELTEGQFASLFAPYHPIHVKLVVDKARRCSLGYGFLVFNTREEADACIIGMNGMPVMSKRLKVTLAKPREEVKFNSNVYIAGIPPGWSEQLMREVAAPFGDIIEHRLMPAQAGHTTLSGFVRYSRRQESDNAITALHGLPVTVEGPLISPTDPYLATKKRDYIGRLGVFHLTARYASDTRTRQKERMVAISQGYPMPHGHGHGHMHASGVPMHVVMAAVGPSSMQYPPAPPPHHVSMGYGVPGGMYPAAPAPPNVMYGAAPLHRPGSGMPPYAYGVSPGNQYDYGYAPPGGMAHMGDPGMLGMGPEAYDYGYGGAPMYGSGDAYGQSGYVGDLPLYEVHGQYAGEAEPPSVTSTESRAQRAHNDTAMPSGSSAPPSATIAHGSPASASRTLGGPTGRPTHPGGAPREARLSGPAMLLEGMRLPLVQGGSAGTAGEGEAEGEHGLYAGDQRMPDRSQTMYAGRGGSWAQAPEAGTHTHGFEEASSGGRAEVGAHRPEHYTASRESAPQGHVEGATTYGTDELQARFATLQLTMSDPMPSRRLNYLTQQSYAHGSHEHSSGGGAARAPARGHEGYFTGGGSGVYAGPVATLPGGTSHEMGMSSGRTEYRTPHTLTASDVRSSALGHGYDWHGESGDALSTTSSRISSGAAPPIVEGGGRGDASSVATMTLAPTVPYTTSVMAHSSATSSSRILTHAVAGSMTVSPDVLGLQRTLGDTKHGMGLGHSASGSSSGTTPEAARRALSHPGPASSSPSMFTGARFGPEAGSRSPLRAEPGSARAFMPSHSAGFAAPPAGSTAEARAASRASQAIRSLRDSDHVIASMSSGADVTTSTAMSTRAEGSQRGGDQGNNNGGTNANSDAAASALPADLRAALSF